MMTSRYTSSSSSVHGTDPIEGGSSNDYDYVAGDPVNQFDLDGHICWSCHAKKLKKWGKRNFLTARGLGNFAGDASKWAGRGAVAAGIVAITIGSGGTAAVVLGVASTAFSAGQLGAGLKSGNRCHVRSGAVGTAVGLITLGTWGAVGKGLGLTGRASAAFGLYGNTSRQLVYEVSGHGCR